MHRELTDADIAKIVSAYHAWRGDMLPSPAGGESVARGAKPDGGEGYQDIPGFCKSADLDLIKQHGFVLTPGRYVGAEEIEDDGELFEEKMSRLVFELNGQFAESAKLESAIRANLKGLGYGS